MIPTAAQFGQDSSISFCRFPSHFVLAGPWPQRMEPYLWLDRLELIRSNAQRYFDRSPPRNGGETQP
jgi:hypothetical protein